MKKASVLLLAITIASILFACKKVIGTEEVPMLQASQGEIAKIKDWILSHKDFSNAGWTDSLIMKAGWRNSEKVLFRDSVYLISIPIDLKVVNSIISSSLLPANNTTKNCLLFSIDKSERILQGSIAQLTPENTISESHTLTLIEKIYARTSDRFNGAYSIFTIATQFLYQIKFKNNAEYSQISVSTQIPTKSNAPRILSTQPLGEKNNFFVTNTSPGTTTIISTNTRLFQTCINWYLVTTLPGGFQIWDFLYQTCSDCEQTSINPIGEVATVKVFCSGGNHQGGSSGNSCTFTNDDASLMDAGYVVESSDPGSSSSYSGEWTDGSGVVRKNVDFSPWMFFKADLPLGYYVSYSAYYTGVEFKNNIYDNWKYESITYQNQLQTGGSTPPCTSMSMSVAPGSSNISGDQRTANSTLTYSAVLTITCVGGTMAGTARVGTLTANWGTAM